MTSERSTTLVTPELAALVELHPRERPSQVTWGVAKRTYRITERGLVLTEARDLQHDIRREDLKPRWPPGSDFWPFKAATDVVVSGSAFARPDQAVHRRRVSLKVHRAVKRIDVWGRRELEWTSDGKARLGAPEPFESVELSSANAYGGIDARVPFPSPRSIMDEIRLLVDRPGMYPRNPMGKGYVVLDSPIAGVELPNLEDPEHPLTAENVVVGDPSSWFKQPLPWCLDWLTTLMFPRVGYAGENPWFPVPDPTALEEVRRGFVPKTWREIAGDLGRGKPPPPIFFQEASLGMTFAELATGIPFELEGMHPECDRLAFAMPLAPKLEIEIEGDRQPVEAKVLHVVITPHEERVEITWAGIRNEMPRAFIAGIHGRIPITMYVDGTPVPYLTPTPIRARLKEAERRNGGPVNLSKMVRRPGEPGYFEVQGLLLPEGTPQRERDQDARSDSPMLGDLDCAAGRVLLEETDWHLRGPVPFAFTRSYSSSMAWRGGSLGVGWSHCLEQAVWEEGGWVMYRMPDGREIGVPAPDGALGIGARVHHAGVGVTIARISTEVYEARLAEGARFGFTMMNEAVQTAPAKARLSRIIGMDGAPLAVRYDTHGRLERLVLPSGQYARFEHDARGRLTRIFQPSRDARDWVLAARYEVDSAGQLQEAVDGAGRATRYRYQARRLTQRSRPGGVTRRFVYSGSGHDARCTFERWGDGLERELFWNPSERVAGVDDATGSSRSLRTTPRYQVERVLDWFANETVRQHDEVSGLLASQTTKDGETTFLYDAAYHLADVSYPDGGSDALEHDAAGRLVSWRDADGHEARWGWDHLGRLGAAIDRTGASVVYEYDDEGLLKTVLAPGEARLGVIRDPSTQAVLEVRAATGSRRAAHDVLSRIVEVTDEGGATTRFRYDPCGRTSQVELPSGLVRAFESDADGRVTSVRDGVVALRFERDPFGRVVHVDEADAGPRLHRDAEGRVTMVESEAGDLWELKRDAAGRVREESGYGDEAVHTLRDHAGRITREMRGASRTTVTRDAMGRPTNVEHDDESFQRFKWTNAGWLARAQDADRVLELERDGEGRLTRETQGEHWVHSTYDAAGRRVSLSSSLGLAVRIERDVLGGAVQITAERAGQRLELGFARDACGRESRRSLPGGVEVRWTRDALGRPTERMVFAGNDRLAAHGWGWAGIDRVVRTHELRGTREHHHDARGRCVGAGSQIRALDEVGNVYRVRERDDHRYAPGGRLLEAYGVEYGYDGEGRRTEKKTLIDDPIRYRWDALGRLVEVALSPTTRVVYDYDALGRRTRRRHEQQVEVPGLDEPVWEALRETQFVWDGLTLLHEIDGESVVTWLWEEGLLLGKLTSSGAFAVLTDAVGMPTELVDETGALAWRGDVDVFGVVQRDIAATDCPWRFPGHWEDPDTGLAHALFRVYDPESGAYLSPSPLGVAGGPNLYAYLPDPFSHASPLGLSRGCAALAGALRSERLAAELIAIALRSLDRGDGAAGPRACFDPSAARPALPDPEAYLWGPWESLRPARRMPPSTSTFTRLPPSTGFVDPDA